MDRRDFLLGTSAAALATATPVIIGAVELPPVWHHVQVVKRVVFVIDDNGSVAEVLEPETSE